MQISTFIYHNFKCLMFWWIWISFVPFRKLLAMTVPHYRVSETSRRPLQCFVTKRGARQKINGSFLRYIEFSLKRPLTMPLTWVWMDIRFECFPQLAKHWRWRRRNVEIQWTFELIIKFDISVLIRNRDDKFKMVYTYIFCDE